MLIISGNQFSGDFGHALALEFCTVKLMLGRLTRAIAVALG